METAVTVLLVLLCIVAVFCCWGFCTFWVRRHKRRSTFQDLESAKYWIGPNPTERVEPTAATIKVHISPAQHQASQTSMTAAQNFCRSCAHDRAITGNLDFIGSTKFFCFVNDARVNKDQGRQVRLVLSSVPIKLRKASHEMLSKLILAVRHPYVLDTLDLGFSKDETCAFFLRPWSPEGSLRDFIYEVDPKEAYYVKYRELRDRKQPRSVQIEVMRTLGRQILEGVGYFRALGVPYVNLHTGNVVLFNGTCKLTDYEDAFCGPKTPAFKQLLKYKSKDPTVSAFGLILYEMANGYAHRDGAPLTTDKPGYALVNQLLQFIFEQGATFEELLSHPFFQVKIQTVNLNLHTRPDAYIKECKSTGKLLARIAAEWSSQEAPPPAPPPPVPESKAPPKKTKKHKKPVPQSESDASDSNE